MSSNRYREAGIDDIGIVISPETGSDLKLRSSLTAPDGELKLPIFCNHRPWVWPTPLRSPRTFWVILLSCFFWGIT